MSPSADRILFVEDDDALRTAMAQSLALEGMHVDMAARADDALRNLAPDFAGVIVSDIRLPGMDGLEFFEKVRALDPEIPFILTTGHGDVAMAVAAMKQGAADFLTKPYASAKLIEAIRRAADKRRLILENRSLRSALDKREKPGFLGSSPAAEQVRNRVAAIAATDLDVMISGASGTGKTFVAQQIHNLSARRNRPLVVIDPGTVAHEDSELILFGRVPGSGLSRSGLIEKAHGGTLLLDRVEAMPTAFQDQLLTLVESRTILPLGGDRPRPVNIRVISTTNTQSSGANPGDRAISASLHQRLSATTIALPELSERRDDISEIFRHFVVEYEREMELEARDLGPEEWRYLSRHDWPGNVTELRTFARNFVLGLTQIDQFSSAKSAEPALKDLVAGFEKSVLEDALRQHKGRVVDVCNALQVQRKTLYDKLTKYGLHPHDYR